MKKEKEKKKEIAEENRKIRYLRTMVDLTYSTIASGTLSLEEAQRLVEATKGATLKLFPKGEETFELIYRPRLSRLIREVYQLH